MLYLKPRAVLIVDEAVPAEKDVEVDLLFHTRWKKDISIEPVSAAFAKEHGTLFLYSVLPTDAAREIVGEPHFLYQYSAQPLIERGYLQVSAPTRGQRLVLANFLTSVAGGAAPPSVAVTRRPDAASVVFSDGAGAWNVSVSSGGTAAAGEWSSDGLLLAVDKGGRVFAANAGFIARNGSRIIESDQKFVGEIKSLAGGLAVRLRLESSASVSLLVEKQPVAVTLDGRPLGPVLLRSSDSPSRLEASGGAGGDSSSTMSSDRKVLVGFTLALFIRSVRGGGRARPESPPGPRELRLRL